MSRAPSVCNVPGCTQLAPAGKGRCPTHTRAQRRASDQRRGGGSARGYGRKWEATRAAFLQAHPICQHPGGCIANATVVHHIDGQGPLAPTGHDPSNLQALCKHHHDQRTATEQQAQWEAKHAAST